MKKRAFIIICSAVIVGVLAFKGMQPNANTSLTYHGEYVDLIAQSEINAPAGNDAIHIAKLSSETGYAICTSIQCNDTYLVFPKLYYQGEKMQLRFENNVLTGCRAYTEMSLNELLQDLWNTSPELLEDVLAEYIRQVQNL